VGGLPLRLSNGQRVVRDRRSDEAAVGRAGWRLRLADDRLRLGRLAIGSSKPCLARRRRLAHRTRPHRPMGFGAAAFAKRFRFYSFATIAILAGCGTVTGLAAPRIQANLPTPWIGVWERINIGVFLVWVAMLATTLLRGRDRVTANGHQDGLAA